MSRQLAVGLIILLMFTSAASAQSYSLQTIAGKLELVNGAEGGTLMLNRRVIPTDDEMPGDLYLHSYYPQFDNDNDVLLIENRSGGSMGSSFFFLKLGRDKSHLLSPAIQFDKITIQRSKGLLVAELLGWDGTAKEIWGYQNGAFQRYARNPLAVMPLDYSILNLRRFIGRSPGDCVISIPEISKRLRALLGDKYALFSDNISAAEPWAEREGTLLSSGFKPHDASGNQAVIALSLKDLSVHCAILSPELNPYGFIIFSESPNAIPEPFRREIARLSETITTDQY